MNKVLFWRGLMKSYKALQERYNNVIYFVIDEKRLFLGNLEISNNNDDDVDKNDVKIDEINEVYKWNFSDLEITDNFLPNGVWESDVKFIKDNKWYI